MRHPLDLLRAIPSAIALVAMGTSACSDTVPTRNSLKQNAVEAVSIQQTSCGPDCVVLAQRIPTLSPAARDSLTSNTWLGETTVRGRLGGKVLVGLFANTTGVAQIPTNSSLVVTVGETTSRIPLTQLGSAYTIYEFTGDETVRIGYALTRSTEETTVPAGLVQLTRNAELVASRNPFAKDSRESLRPMFAPGFDSPCPFDAPGIWCHVNLAFNRYSPGGFGADFQSGPGNGPSQLILITFGADISSLTISVYDPDFAGNKVIAFDSNSVTVASVDVPHDNTPTVLTIETVTVSAPRIRKVQLLPAPADYVAYADASFVRAPCPPTGDPILDSPDVRKVMLDLLAASRPNPNGAGKKELGAYLYQDSAGTYNALPINDPNATDCAFTVPGGSPLLPPGAVAVGVFHTHPSTAGERLFGCRNTKPGEIRRASRNPAAGGGSPTDWQTATDTGSPQYVLNLDRKLARLDPDVPVAQRGNNPHQWKFNPGSDCLVPGP